MAERNLGFGAGVVVGVLVWPVGGLLLGGCEGPRPPAQVRKVESGIVQEYTQPPRDGKNDGFRILFDGPNVAIFPTPPTSPRRDQEKALSDGAKVLFDAGCVIGDADPEAARRAEVGGEEFVQLELHTTAQNAAECASNLPVPPEVPSGDGEG